ncbi:MULTISPECIES: low molecular weight phosphatase family protein [unclassified Solwaraspora]|uniref:arsenate reductase/protein-tyrosine-phosphatase family protein n=1 Tax=unclassified Solwaraspora TaxID=2627926 RepID=UPI00248A9A9B|nr:MULTISPECIES: low molecular weight phosphatase family protein [unclassified Solwaraspora]WBB99657.1 low molecular weight phosphatase family protein [Solwaraspora sp. WMMA2059]WBC21793.1 low molecular weight phosphatase family protein [Solwaraspora sp. WMMA2080]WJK36160.1 low molecular weight phosphatase family protein [Solwaraspora sp. WMMA2065]
MTTDRFTILFVCRANICRSPLAERLTRYAVQTRLGTDSDGVVVDSAGTEALTGQPMHPHTEQVLRERQADPDGFVSRQVDAAMLTGADLVLTASRRHRAYCVALAPAALTRTFTVRQFGRLAQAAALPSAASPPGAAGRARSLVAAAAAARSRVQPVSAEQDDLADPVLRPVEDFRGCASQIDQTVDILLDIITKS